MDEHYDTKQTYVTGTVPILKVEELLRHGPKNHSSLLGGAKSCVTHM